MDVSIIYLVGFMGAGKTSVGQRLAELLGWSFVDVDQKIEEREGTPIREIFLRAGEPYFRRVESEELQSLSAGKNLVVALGGGAFCSLENQRVVQRTGTSVWLDAPMEILFSRCKGDGSRPLFTTRAAMKDLIGRRRPFYAKADLRVRVGRLSVDQIADKILVRLKSCASLSG